MKTDKEYPATHSMYTAWYVADEDGNVGIMDFNDNGPVPWETEQTSVDSLVYGHDEDYENKEFLPISLTEEQIDDLMDNPHSPEEEDLWLDRIVQIDMNKEKEFLELAKNPDFDLERCVSRERGLYDIGAFRCTSDSETDGRCQILENSTLRTMIDQGMILRVFDKKDFWMTDDWEGDEIVHKKNFSSAPYYLFHQPYWVHELPVCMNVPKVPVKLEQIPEKFRERVLRLPLRFKDTERFQIAEWYPCVASEVPTRTEIVNGCEYELLPLTDGSQAYICTEIILPSEFYRYCSQKGNYLCTDCKSHCHTCWDHCFTNKPTVFVVMHPLEEWDFYTKTKTDRIVMRSVWLPFLPHIPLKLRADSYHSSNTYRDYLSDEDIKKHVNQQMVLDFSRKNRKWFEDIVARFRPRVLLVSDMAKPIIEAIYSLDSNSIEIAGVSFPVYLLSEMDLYRKEIEQLATMPYQGEQIPHIISIEEMEKLKQQQ